MKKAIIIIPLLVLIVGVFIFMNGESPSEKLDTDNLSESFEDEILYTEAKTVYLKEGNSREEVDVFEKDIEGLSWSKDGRYFIVDTVDKTHLYIRDGLIFVKEFNSNGSSIFSDDSRKLLLGISDDDNDLVIYNIESKYVEQVVEGVDGEYYVPISWQGQKIVYLEGKSKDKKELILEERDEDKLMDMVKDKGDYREVISLLNTIDRDLFTKKYGDNSIREVLEYLKDANIDDEESMVAMISMSDSFVGQEYHKYVEVLGEMYLNNISNFVKALTREESKTKDIAYALHDLKLYERLDSNLTEDLNSIVMSKDLTAKEKEIGMNLITTYSDCGA